MIYCYFDNNQGLCFATLKESYCRFREIESDIDIYSLAPMPALQGSVGANFDDHAAHPVFICMVMSEKINHGEYIRNIPELGTINRSSDEEFSRCLSRDTYSQFVAPKASIIRNNARSNVRSQLGN